MDHRGSPESGTPDPRDGSPARPSPRRGSPPEPHGGRARTRRAPGCLQGTFGGQPSRGFRGRLAASCRSTPRRRLSCPLARALRCCTRSRSMTCRHGRFLRWPQCGLRGSRGQTPDESCCPRWRGCGASSCSWLSPIGNVGLLIALPVVGGMHLTHNGDHLSWLQ